MTAIANANNFFNKCIDHSDHNIDYISRCPHDKDNPFTVISNYVINGRITNDCFTILSFLLSKKNDWRITVKNVYCEFQKRKERMGINKVRRVLNEAKDAGFITMNLKKTSKGRGKIQTACHYFLSEKPIKKDSDLGESFRRHGFRDDEARCPTINTRSSKEDLKEQQLQKKPIGVVVPLIPKKEEQASEEEVIKAKKAADQYIENQKKKGNAVNEKAIHKQALKELWGPNVTKEDKDKEKAHKEAEMTYKAMKNREELKKLIETKKEIFSSEFSISLSDHAAQIKIGNRFASLPYLDPEFVPTIERFISMSRSAKP